MTLTNYFLRFTINFHGVPPQGNFTTAKMALKTPRNYIGMQICTILVRIHIKDTDIVV